jgi:hypothetical protein
VLFSSLRRRQLVAGSSTNGNIVWKKADGLYIEEVAKQSQEVCTNWPMSFNHYQCFFQTDCSVSRLSAGYAWKHGQLADF